MTSEVQALRKELHDHVLYCETRFNEGATTHAQLLSQQQECNEQLAQLVSNTADIIMFQNNVRGAVKLADGAQKVGLWLLKWPLIGVGLYAGYKAILKFLADLE